MYLRGNCIRPAVGGQFTRPFARGFSVSGSSEPAVETQRQFPADAVEWAAAFPGITAPSEIWTFQEAASPVVGQVAAKNLVQNQALLYQQAGDTEPTDSPRLSVEFDSASSAAEYASVSGDATFGNIAAGASISLYVRFRVPDTGGNARTICGKGASAARWGFTFTATGLLRGTLSDGVNSQSNPTTAGSYDDGNYHDVVFVVDAANALIRIITESEEVTLAISAALQTSLASGISIAEALRFGSGLTGLTVQAGSRVSYAAFWANTAITAANLTTIRTPI